MKKQLSYFLVVNLFTGFAFAGPASGSQSFVYEGMVFLADGITPSTSVVDLNVGIYSPDGTCLLYEEKQTSIDLSLTQGAFAIAVGSAVGATKRTVNDPGLSMSTLLANSLVQTTSTLCPSGYTATTGDGRKLRLTVVQAGVSTVMTPDMVLGSTPTAMVADSLQGLGPSQLIQANTSANLSQTNVESIFTGTGFTDLQALIAGTSPKYMTASGSTFNASSDRITNLATPTATTDAVNKGYSDTKLAGSTIDTTGLANGETVVWNSSLTKWVVATPSTTDTTKLPLTGGALTGSLNMSANDITSTGNIAMSAQKNLLLGTYTTANESALTSSLTSSASDTGKMWYNSTNGQIKYWNGTTATALGVAGAGVTAITAGTGLNVGVGPGGTITTTGTLNVNSGTGASQIVQLDASARLPAVDASQVINLSATQISNGLLPIARGGLGAALTPAGKGEIVYSNSASAITSLPAGTAGSVLTSAGVGASPTWSAVPSDTTKVSKAGDTMTGLLLLSADPTSVLGAATKEYVDASAVTAVAPYLRKDGTTPFTGPQSMASNRINNLQDPASPQDAATKNYTDTTFLKLTGGALTSSLSFAAGTVSNAPFYMSSGTLLTTPSPGALEYDGTSLYFTNSASVRATVASIQNLTQYVPVSGGTMNNTLNISSGTSQSLNLTNSSTNPNLIVTHTGGGPGAVFASGLVGIGTGSPATTLDVSPTTVTTGSVAQIRNLAAADTSPTLLLDNNGTTGPSLQVGSTGSGITFMKMCSATSVGAGSPTNTVPITFTITCSGALVGDNVNCSPNANPGTTIVWNAFIATAGNITVKLSNTTTTGTATAANWLCHVVR